MFISIRCAGHNPQGKAFFCLAGSLFISPLLPERAFFLSLHPFRQENFIRCDTLVPTIFLERQGYL